MEGVGPIPQRAAMGHRARGLQHQRRRVELLQSRPGAVARLQVGRGRHRRHLRRPPTPLPGVRRLERRRPDPQGADVRSDQCRGQPWRGRQGVLLLPRRHAHRLLPEVPVPVPAAGVPVRRPHRHQRPAQPVGDGVRAPRHRGVRRRSLCRHRRRVRQGGARRHPRADHDRQSQRRTRHGPPAADAVVPQHLVDGPAEGEPTRRRRCRDHGRAPRSRGARAAVRRRTGAAVHRERDEHRAAGRDTERHAVREGRLPPLSRRRRVRRRQPGAHRHEGGRPLRGGARRRRRGDDRAASVPTRRQAAQAQGSPRRVRRPARRCGRVLRLDRAEHGARRPAGGDAPGVGRHGLEQAALLLRPRPLARRAREPPAARRRRIRAAQPRLVPHGQRRRDLDAGHVGVPVVRLLGPGVPHRRPEHGRRRLRQGPARPDAARAVPPPERPAAGVRVELQRRQPSGARVGDTARLRDRARTARRGRHRLAEERLPEAARQLHVVGQSEGPDRAQRVRGWLPRPRQHRRLRPQRAAADGRQPRAVRRHGVDGVLRPEHARHRRRAQPSRSDVRGHGDEVRRALRLHRRGDGPRRRPPRRAVGRGGRVLLRPVATARTGAPNGSRSARWSACSRCARRRCCPSAPTR